MTFLTPHPAGFINFAGCFFVGGFGKRCYLCALKNIYFMLNEIKDIIIANPMYDVVFKHLMMADKNIARFFIGAILGVEIVDVEFLAQDYSYTENVKTGNIIETVRIHRLDFVATIRTGDGKQKRVLIEIQQTFTPADILRFRSYLGRQYQQRDNIVMKNNKIVDAMPIVVIYMLGFNFENITDLVVKIKRSAVNVISEKDVKMDEPFFESLTHDAYFVQVARIEQEMFDKWEKCCDLLKMLSLFEQNNFIVPDKKFIKKYSYHITDKLLIKMAQTLEYLAADPAIRRAMEEEEFARLNEQVWQQTFETQSNTIATQSNTIAQQDDALQKALARIAELEQQIGLN
jgi:hypothetical protein